MYIETSHLPSYRSCWRARVLNPSTLSLRTYLLLQFDGLNDDNVPLDCPRWLCSAARVLTRERRQRDIYSYLQYYRIRNSGAGLER